VSDRLSRSRQLPLGPDEVFSALVTRLIMTNRAERANWDRIRPTLSALPEAGDDGRGEPRRRATAKP
jgi:hypothetical protein